MSKFHVKIILEKIIAIHNIISFITKICLKRKLKWHENIPKSLDLTVFYERMLCRQRWENRLRVFDKFPHIKFTFSFSERYHGQAVLSVMGTSLGF